MAAITLTAPMVITSRLMAGARLDDGSTLHLAPLADEGHRIAYRYIIESADGDVLADGADLRASDDVREALASLCSFLAAAAESYEYEQRTGRDGRGH